MFSFDPMRKVVFVAILNTILMGCDGLSGLSFGPETTTSICQQYPQLCSDLNQDGWCKHQRSDLIHDRKEELLESSDANKYRLLRAWQSYESCIELASQVEPKDNPERKTSRVEGLMTAVKEIERLSTETENSSDPFWLLYHWQERRDPYAKQKFLALEGKPEMRHPELIWALAAIYAGPDPVKSLQLMHYSLALYDKDEAPPVTHIQAMTTHYMNFKDYRNAYIWSKVQEELGGGKANFDALFRYHKFTKKELRAMNNTAEDIAEEIADGEYRVR